MPSSMGLGSYLRTALHISRSHASLKVFSTIPQLRWTMTFSSIIPTFWVMAWLSIGYQVNFSNCSRARRQIAICYCFSLRSGRIAAGICQKRCVLEARVDKHYAHYRVLKDPTLPGSLEERLPVVKGRFRQVASRVDFGRSQDKYIVRTTSVFLVSEIIIGAGRPHVP